MLRVFLINLDRRPERLARMRAQADRQGISFERIRGVDGLSLPDNMRGEFLAPRGRIASKMLVGEVGCYASHMRAWETVIDNCLSHAMVLEDDVICEQEFAAIADAAVRCWPAGWDLIHLHSTNKKAMARVA